MAASQKQLQRNINFRSSNGYTYFTKDTMLKKNKFLWEFFLMFWQKV